MAYIDWQDDFSVKVREIDDQHKVLVGMINSVHEAMLANKGRELQREVVNKMTDYAVRHFALEEKYMKQFAFAGYEKHKVEHDRFTEKAAELKDRMSRTGFVLSLEILNFLRDWLSNHILKVDKEYSLHFERNGLR